MFNESSNHTNYEESLRMIPMSERLSHLQQHRQLYPKSCAPAAMEVLPKLYKLIDSDDFRFQNDHEENNIGFEKLDELRDFGIGCRVSTLSIGETLDCIERETSQGRFPLISLPVIEGGVFRDYHIYVAAQDNGTLMLIEADEAGSIVHMVGREHLERWCLDIIPQLRVSPTIDFATYSILELRNGN
jgi:hypothetical protein